MGCYEVERLYQTATQPCVVDTTFQKSIIEGVERALRYFHYFRRARFLPIRVGPGFNLAGLNQPPRAHTYGETR
uniref:Uncharacterized protein n=1 Tax=Pseudomonas phage PA_L9 TaxID=3232177 RepID=A0AAU8L0Z4_9CAUD